MGEGEGQVESCGSGGGPGRQDPGDRVDRGGLRLWELVPGDGDPPADEAGGLGVEVVVTDDSTNYGAGIDEAYLTRQQCMGTYETHLGSCQGQVEGKHS